MINVLYTEKTVEHETPHLLFKILNDIFHLEIDAAARYPVGIGHRNNKCEVFIDRETNAIKTNWKDFADEWQCKPRFWMNPPYGRGEKACKKNCKKKKCAERGYHAKNDIPSIGDFVKKAADMAEIGCSTVCLLPARTAETWFHEQVLNRANAITFIRGRIKFLDKNGNEQDQAPMPNILAFYGICPTRDERRSLELLGVTWML